MKRCLILVLLASLMAIPTHARLGDTLNELKKRYGKPESEPKKNESPATWLLEGEEGQLIYTVTFDAKGRSIGEGMRPLRYAKFSPAIAQSFIAMQLTAYLESKTMRNVKPGEEYKFGGKNYKVAAIETVIVDEANDFLIVWTQGPTPSVMAVRQAMIQ